MSPVAVVQILESRYPELPPFHPSDEYPEYPFSHFLSHENNYVYRGVRQVFYELGLDRAHYGTNQWNPLGSLIEPGMSVVIKPNFVLSRHRESKDLYSIITNPSVLRAIIDYCWIALKGRGQIQIADAPQYDCNFGELLEATQLIKLCEFYSQFPGPPVEYLDLRQYWSRSKHFPSLLIALPGDPQGSIIVELGKNSALYKKPQVEKLYGAVYHRSETISHHSEDRHEYEVSRTIMGADVVISVPKLKVHKKVGVTLNAKGLVGAATNKNYLVHYTLTPPSQGGDQYPDGHFSPPEELLIRLERMMYDRLLAPQVHILEYIHRIIYAIHNISTKRLGIGIREGRRWLDAGNWYGNDSAWRMTVDLLKAFYFADRQGTLQDTKQRRMFSVIDGIVGGEHKGPLVPDPKRVGVLVAGENLVAVDVVATRLMGFDPLKLKLYKYLLQNRQFDFGVRDFSDVEIICSTNRVWENCLSDPVNRFLDFRPHPGWVGHIEVDSLQPQQHVEVQSD